MNITLSFLPISLFLLLFSVVFFWLASKSSLEKRNYFLFPAFYFLVLAFIGFVISSSYSFGSVRDCDYVINSTTQVNNTTSYTYNNSCAHLDFTSMEYYFVLLSWTLYGIIIAGFMYLVYFVYDWMRRIW